MSTGKLKLICNVCQKRFPNEDKLEVHFIKHSEDAPYGCLTCYKTFNDYNSLVQHLHKHTNIIDVCDEESDAETDTISDSETNITQYTRVNVDPYSCNICYRTFSNQKCLSEHIEQHIGNNLYVHAVEQPLDFDEQSADKFSNSDELESHIHVNSRRKKHECHVCKKVFSRPSYLKRHLLVHTKRGEEATACQTCNKTFERLEQLENHLCGQTGEEANMDGNEKGHIIQQGASAISSGLTFSRTCNTFACHICNKIFARIYDFDSHMKLHNGRNMDLDLCYKCEICHTSYVNREYLRLHRFEHTKIKLHICDICNNKYSKPSALKAHRYTHGGERPEKCQLCSSSFLNRGELKRHMRKHTGETPFTCHICQKTFRYASSLKDHSYLHVNR